MTDRYAQPPEEGSTDAEGVRIIGAEEAQEAIERGDVASRLSDKEPRPGDRAVPSASDGPRPTLRFPLRDSESPHDVARPAVVPPPEPPPGADADATQAWSETDDAWYAQGEWPEGGSSAPGEGEPAYGEPTYDEPSRGGYDDDDYDRGGYRSDYDAPATGGYEPAPRDYDAPGGGGHEEPPDPYSEAVPGSYEQPVGAYDEAIPSGFEAPSRIGYGEEPAWADTGGEAESWEPAAWDAAEDEPSSPAGLPHWTDPPTGEVPAMIASESDDLDAWSSFASSPPRWRDEHHDWAEGDYDDMSALGDEESRVGALDPALAEGSGSDEDPFGPFDEPEPAWLGPPEQEPEPSAVAVEPEPPRERPKRRPLRRFARPEGAGAAHDQGRDVQTAAMVGLVLGIAALVLIGFAPPKIGILAVTAGAAIGAWEFFGVTLQGGARAAVPVGLAGAAGLPLAVYWRGPQAIPLVIVLALFAALLWYVVGAGGNAPVLEGVGTTLLGVGWIGVLASFAAQFLQLHQGRSMLISVILVVVASDVGGFFGGRSLGRTPLSRVSPNKTREGALTGIVAAIVVGVIVGIFDVGVYRGVGAGFLLGLVVGVAAAIGDLCESVIKRDLGVKDMGTLLPGHGGLLDRIDGLLFALPAAFYLIYAFHLHY